MLTLSPILRAVKPQERTDQYAILATLYCLDAHKVPVTAKQVAELLHLHLGKKAPKNVHASLRAYVSYAEPAEKGPPLRWRLTPKGLDQLRVASGLQLATGTTDTDFGSDVGIICALEQPEFEAVARAVGGQSKWKVVGDTRFPHVYRESALTTSSGQLLRLIAILRDVPAVDLDTLEALDKEVEALNTWALERVAQEAMEAEQFWVFSQVVTQVWQAIARRRARRR